MTLGDFSSKYIAEPNSGCWIWIGAYTKRTPMFGKNTARRFIYENKFGTMDKLGMVKVKCGNSTCVNPQHSEFIHASNWRSNEN